MVDVHGHSYLFKHSFGRGSNKLTAGWNKYSQRKSIRSGNDAVVFMRRAEGGLLIGSRRGGPSIDRAVELIDQVHEAEEMVAGGEPFTVTYYPRQRWAFVVPRNLVEAALDIDWQPGMPMRMAIPVDPHELESSRQFANTPAFYEGAVSVVNDSHWCKLEVRLYATNALCPCNCMFLLFAWYPFFEITPLCAMKCFQHFV